MAKMLLQTDFSARTKERNRYRMEQMLSEHKKFPKRNLITKIRAQIEGESGLYFEPRWFPTQPLEVLMSEVLGAVKQLYPAKYWNLGKVSKTPDKIMLSLVSNKKDILKIRVEL